MPGHSSRVGRPKRIHVVLLGQRVGKIVTARAFLSRLAAPVLNKYVGKSTEKMHAYIDIDNVVRKSEPRQELN
jgi:hypothetical protein